jgi:cell division protein ZapA
MLYITCGEEGTSCVNVQGRTFMSAKTETEVMIGGKVFTLSGSESEEYLQRVAIYINNKYAEYNKIDSFRKQSVDYKNVLLQLNIADDYFKAKKKISKLEEELERKEKELYDLKHELIANQIKLESTEKTMKSMQEEINEGTKKIVRLEAELKEKK